MIGLTKQTSFFSMLMTALIFFSGQAQAQDTSTSPSGLPRALSLSAFAGQETLFTDPGYGAPNSFAGALAASYLIESNIALELRYLRSSHGEVDHSDIGFGVNYSLLPLPDFGNALPYLSLGISLLRNNFKDLSRAGDSGGIFFGGGADFEVLPNFRIGPEIRYVKGITARANLEAREFNSVADGYELMLKLSYSIPTE